MIMLLNIVEPELVVVNCDTVNKKNNKGPVYCTLKLVGCFAVSVESEGYHSGTSTPVVPITFGKAVFTESSIKELFALQKSVSIVL